MSSAFDPQVPPVVEEGVEGHSDPVVQAGPVVAGRELLRDLVLILIWVAASDLLIYQIGTYAAWAALFVGSVLFLAVTKRSLGVVVASLTVAALLVCLGLKLIWCGAWLQVACGALLIVGYAMSLAGSPPFLPELFAFLVNMFSGAVRRVCQFRFGTVNEVTGVVRPALGIQILLPCIVVLSFVGLFIMANPSIADSVAMNIRLLSDAFGKLLVGFEVTEAIFWFGSAWLVLGLLYPARRYLIPERSPRELLQAPTTSSLYLASRNTLVSVIALFACYLVFEFSTLWFQVLPADFYYAGYAHQGAFWLTVGLGLATVVLSAIFRGSVLSDPRFKSLKRLAIIWSVQNFLLSVAVYNRLLIYIDFNGMTRMRVIGLLGITAVVVGFLLVVVKLANNKGFVWLLHRQLWVPTLAMIVYAILPVDWIVSTYNTTAVLAGDPKPIVQVIAHPTSAAGMLPLTKLVDSDDPVIRDGVRAMLAIWAHELAVGADPQNDSQGDSPEELPTESMTQGGARRSGIWRSSMGHSTPWVSVEAGFSRHGHRSRTAWHDFQGAEFLLRRKLAQLRPHWSIYAAATDRRTEALNRFFQHSYQWY